jgi:hypothetical protein
MKKNKVGYCAITSVREEATARTPLERKRNL